MENINETAAFYHFLQSEWDIISAEDDNMCIFSDLTFMLSAQLTSFKVTHTETSSADSAVIQRVIESVNINVCSFIEAGTRVQSYVAVFMRKQRSVCVYVCVCTEQRRITIPVYRCTQVKRPAAESRSATRQTELWRPGRARAPN